MDSMNDAVHDSKEDHSPFRVSHNSAHWSVSSAFTQKAAYIKPIHLNKGWPTPILTYPEWSCPSVLSVDGTCYEQPNDEASRIMCQKKPERPYWNIR